MSDLLQEIADLEAEIDALARAAERCRKVIVLAKMATGAGSLLLILALVGLIRVGPMALVLAITAVVGGVALFGSHQSTRDEIAARIRAHEARRAELIDAMGLQTISGDGETETFKALLAAGQGRADPEPNKRCA
jgi:hypothetical protein